MRTTLDRDPAFDRSRHYHERSPFDARWVCHPDAPYADAGGVFVCRYRLAVGLPAAVRVRLHVSADEMYDFFLNGVSLGRGPERAAIEGWRFETYDLNLAAGPHELILLVHSMGRHRAYAQASVRHAALVWAEGDASATFSTGRAAWTAERVNACRPVLPALPGVFVAVGARFEIAAAGLGSPGPTMAVADAGPVVLAAMRMEAGDVWRLRPASLPPMLQCVRSNGRVRRVEGPVGTDAWQQFLDGALSLVVPPNASAVAVVDLDDYICSYASLKTEGGVDAVVSLFWAEALFDADGRSKPGRDRVDGLKFAGLGDTFRCDGGPTKFAPPLWSAGRYAELRVTTAAEPLTLVRLTLTETRYPLVWDGGVVVDDPPIASALPLARRAVEVCAHDTIVDCPYYERLMYAGDTRLVSLVLGAFARDDRLPAKCVRAFDASRGSDGLIQARTPARTSQVIPPFGWWWVGMVHDRMMWRDRPDETAELLAGVSAVMDAAYRCVNRDGLYEPTTGWNFVDWVDGWPGGVPAGGAGRPVAPLQFQLACAAGMAAEIAEAVDEPLLAERHRRKQARLNTAGMAAFYDPGRRLITDDSTRSNFSEHAQTLALLAGGVPDDVRATLADALVRPAALAKASVYFSHYVIEALRLVDRPDAVVERLRAWGNLAGQGFKTTPEKFGPTRSDCHAWGAHPLFHVAATVLGIRPAAPHFGSVRIEPRLGGLRRVEASVVHPHGTIRISAERTDHGVRVAAEWPAGVAGTVVGRGVEHACVGGPLVTVDLPA